METNNTHKDNFQKENNTISDNMTDLDYQQNYNGNQVNLENINILNISKLEFHKTKRGRSSQ